MKIKKYLMKSTLENKALCMSVIMAIVMFGSVVAEAAEWDNKTQAIVNKTSSSLKNKKNQKTGWENFRKLKKIDTIPLAYKGEALVLLTKIKKELSSLNVSGNQIGSLKGKFQTWVEDMLSLAQGDEGAFNQDLEQAMALSLQSSRDRVLAEQWERTLEQSQVQPPKTSEIRKKAPTPKKASVVRAAVNPSKVSSFPLGNTTFEKSVGVHSDNNNCALAAFVICSQKLGQLNPLSAVMGQVFNDTILAQAFLIDPIEKTAGLLSAEDLSLLRSQLKFEQQRGQSRLNKEGINTQLSMDEVAGNLVGHNKTLRNAVQVNLNGEQTALVQAADEGGPFATMEAIVASMMQQDFPEGDSNTNAWFYMIPPDMTDHNKGISVTTKITTPFGQETHLQAVVLHVSGQHFVTITCEPETGNCYYLDSMAVTDGTQPEKTEAVRIRLPGFYTALKENRLSLNESVQIEINGIISEAAAHDFFTQTVRDRLLKFSERIAMLVYTTDPEETQLRLLVTGATNQKADPKRLVRKTADSAKPFEGFSFAHQRPQTAVEKAGSAAMNRVAGNGARPKLLGRSSIVRPNSAAGQVKKTPVHVPVSATAQLAVTVDDLELKLAEQQRKMQNAFRKAQANRGREDDSDLLVVQKGQLADLKKHIENVEKFLDYNELRKELLKKIKTHNVNNSRMTVNRYEMDGYVQLVRDYIELVKNPPVVQASAVDETSLAIASMGTRNDSTESEMISFQQAQLKLAEVYKEYKSQLDFAAGFSEIDKTTQEFEQGTIRAQAAKNVYHELKEFNSVILAHMGENTVIIRQFLIKTMKELYESIEDIGEDLLDDMGKVSEIRIDTFPLYFTSFCDAVASYEK
ncbi:hypothetical protein CI610_02964 [invertebrate metagenome]|uniref:Uncharacterized protein n=1 Tax=invertebrate metagenome TaxID=1711999 RepID=A0A2H9T4I0_9ZZZZ